jgi:hypothetical protein
MIGRPAGADHPEGNVPRGMARASRRLARRRIGGWRLRGGRCSRRALRRTVRSSRLLTGTATITGVGFFDLIHGRPRDTVLGFTARAIAFVAGHRITIDSQTDNAAFSSRRSSAAEIGGNPAGAGSRQCDAMEPDGIEPPTPACKGMLTGLRGTRSPRTPVLSRRPCRRLHDPEMLPTSSLPAAAARIRPRDVAFVWESHEQDE